MLVNKTDGVCRSCSGQLRITDADDATMTVECDEYLVESDAFGDGCITHYVAFLSEAILDEGEGH